MTTLDTSAALPAAGGSGRTPDTATSSASAGKDATAPTSDGLTHIVGWWQWLLGDKLRIKVPRGLCGASLAGVDKPGVTLPLCGQCVKLCGGRRTEYVPPHKVFELRPNGGAR